MKRERPQVLIADDEANLRRVLSAQLQRDGYDVVEVADGDAAVEALSEHHIDLVISDLRMPKRDGMEVLRFITEHHPDVPVIMITAHGTVDTAVEALKLGAYDFVTKPFEKAELRHVIAKAARTRELSERELGGEAGQFDIIGRSEEMRGVYEVIAKVADTPSTVLVTGESGTGKELIARALHQASSRKERPFIRVNCAAIPHELIESELFGYEKGAFTGASTSKPGRFELANGGTLFLDEIGEIPNSMQVKLLRALQEQEFERVGGIRTIRVDVRLVAATNRDLLADIGAGRFREDLYYRLNVVHVHLPPLRERTEDIPLLVEHFVKRFNERLSKGVQGVTPPALERLVAYSWRGNIRELENVIERCLLFAEGAQIRLEDLPETVAPKSTEGPVPTPSAGVPAVRLSDELDPGGLKETVRGVAARVERELIVKALEQTGGNVTQSARILKISRKSLQTKMKELGLREP